MELSVAGRPPRTRRGSAWHPCSESAQTMWFGTAPCSPARAHSPLPIPFVHLQTAGFPNLWIAFPLRGKTSFLTLAFTQTQAKLALPALPWHLIPSLPSPLLPPSPAILSLLQTCVVRPSSTALLFRHRVSEPSRPAPLPVPGGECQQRQLPGSQQPPEHGRQRPGPRASWPTGEHH